MEGGAGCISCGRICSVRMEAGICGQQTGWPPSLSGFECNGAAAGRAGSFWKMPKTSLHLSW